MAKLYWEKLSKLVSDLNLEEEIGWPVEVKHFFSGAALYVNETICASWTPVGLAFKLPQDEVDALIAAGEAKPLKYFPKGRVKKGYALFETPDLNRRVQWQTYFLKAAGNVKE